MFWWCKHQMIIFYLPFTSMSQSMDLPLRGSNFNNIINNINIKVKNWKTRFLEFLKYIIIKLPSFLLHTYFISFRFDRFWALRIWICIFSLAKLLFVFVYLFIYLFICLFVCVCVALFLSLEHFVLHASIHYLLFIIYYLLFIIYLLFIFILFVLYYIILFHDCNTY